MFGTSNPAQKNQQKDPFDFVLDYDQSFLRDDQNKHNMDNQFNTRRSRYLRFLLPLPFFPRNLLVITYNVYRYLPSGKLQQDSLFNMSSATQNASAKGWNQTPIKITVGGAGIGGTGGAGHHPSESGKGGGYVPSFIGSSKGDKKSK